MHPPLAMLQADDPMQQCTCWIYSLRPVLQELHQRLQPLLIFFIDAASFIDEESGDIDSRWELYLAVESTAAGHVIVSTLATCSFLVSPTEA